MSYFSQFPLVRFDDFLGVNLTVRNNFAQRYRDDPSVFYEHSITEGETPEIIADKFYGDAKLHWIIMLFNERHNVFEDWPLDFNSLDSYIKEKYINPFETHHYVSAATGNEVSEDHASYDRVPVSNYDYEVELNDSKRPIKLVLPELVGSVIKQHNELISRNYG